MEKMDLSEEQDLGLIFLIINGKVSMAVNRLLHRSFRKENLEITPEQWTVLAYLWRKDGVTQQTLCNSTFKDKPSMTRLIDNLSKQGLVYRASSKEDRRSNFIYLTDLGKSIRRNATKAVYSSIQTALEGIDNEAMQTVRSVLSTVFGNISEYLEDN